MRDGVEGVDYFRTPHCRDYRKCRYRVYIRKGKIRVIMKKKLDLLNSTVLPGSVMSTTLNLETGNEVCRSETFYGLEISTKIKKTQM